MNIKWRGDKVVNFYSNRIRQATGKQYSPFVIANHVTAGTAQSVYNWFISKSNTNASSHFVVCRNGDIHQYVRLEHAAWTQGITVDAYDRALAPVVKQNKGINPNYYCISIEHEGYMDYDAKADKLVSEGYYGELTEDQFWSSVWLHRRIKDDVAAKWGVNIPLNSHNVIGHFQIDPKRKPNCPGPQFPWERLYKELLASESMTLQDLEMKIDFIKSGGQDIEKIVAVANRVKYLVETAEGAGKWSAEAIRKLSLLLPAAIPILGLADKATPLDMGRSILKSYASKDKQQQLVTLQPIMKKLSLL